MFTIHRGEKVKSVVLKTTQSLNTQTGRPTCDIPSGVISLTHSRLYDSYHVLYTCHVFISHAKGKRVKRQNDNQEPLTIMLGTIGQLIKGGVCAEKQGMCVNVDVDVVRRNRQNREQWKGTCTAVVGCLTEPNKKKVAKNPQDLHFKNKRAQRHSACLYKCDGYNAENRWR